MDINIVIFILVLLQLSLRLSVYKQITRCCCFCFCFYRADLWSPAGGGGGSFEPPNPRACMSLASFCQSRAIHSFINSFIRSLKLVHSLSCLLYSTFIVFYSMHPGFELLCIRPIFFFVMLPSPDRP